MLVGAAFPLLVAVRPRSVVGRSGYALLFVLIATLLFCDRDVAPIFGHLSALAGNPHR
jgi:hypothetical protein